MKRGLSGVCVGLLLALMLSGVVACNTMEGFGQDVEAAGEAIEQQAE